ncbi:immunoglobulin-binding protein 1 [Dromiciops gliroides]|uniref:immunoglobulin-binding protein 1 n=1 Tax=Dromiciops gliroides TaxID=33562 RepID=UPI001CC421B4|nr:immunoglobulin-binding protein 1 [Dromiciops gliroides]XP_043829937.1 immunoglobulin-binding protein 1 [Dromiciops gliroides]
MAEAVAAATEEEEEVAGPRLPQLLETGRRLLSEVEDTNESTNSRFIQEKVKQGLESLDKASRMMAQLDLFSSNEDLEEIASTDLKYLLVPALQGALTLKQVNFNHRLEQVQAARAHFVNFLKQCHNYQIAKFELPQTQDNTPGKKSVDGPSGSQQSLVAMASHRQAKIERYKQKKELENKLASLESAVESGRAEDEQVREYYLLHLQKWVNISLEEIESIDQELVILKARDPGKQASTSRMVPQNRPPTKPFILTRDTAQAKVFGSGYPSLATMTVNEWYEQRQKWDTLKNTTVNANQETEQDEDQETKSEEDDEDALHKKRNWDDWKDTHPRGYGNRQNMG